MSANSEVLRLTLCFWESTHDCSKWDRLIQLAELFSLFLKIKIVVIFGFFYAKTKSRHDLNNKHRPLHHKF